MTVTVGKADGTYTDVVVRYSDKVKKLFTTTSILAKRGVREDELVCASAPLDVYEGEWCDSGLPEEVGFFDTEKKVGSIPYLPLPWNYR